MGILNDSLIPVWRIEMKDDRVMVEASKWYRKFTDPQSGMYRLTHATSIPHDPPFDSSDVLDSYRIRSDARMREHSLALK